MLDTWTIDQYWTEVYCTETDYPDWRRGQVAFNVLANVRPDLAERIRGTVLDPFYNSKILPAFSNWLNDNWETTDNGS